MPFFLCFVFLFTPLYSQNQFILNAGTSHFLGDLGGNFSGGTPSISDLNLASTRYVVGAAYRIKVSNHFAIRTSGYYARLSANDKYAKSLTLRNRNLNFFSPIVGANILGEVHFFVKENISRLYIFGGLEYFHFDPRTRYNGSTVRLQPLGTEGQNFISGKFKYKLTSAAIPFGFGINFLKKTRSYWSFELSARKSFTDYIDDVSTQYVDKALLLASSGQIAVELSDRSLGGIPGFSAPGAIRGKPKYNDNFFFLQFSYNRFLGGKADKRSNGNRERRLVPGKKDCYPF